ncbi:MAG TPA: heme peroxidase family protein [Candidatus Dormibacteraeota bacterium]|nr:heme peroxidase family protein [Candidatus Dormibacteraeota bacterium]
MRHGGADRLLSPDKIDFARLDDALRCGGEGDDGERLALTNDLLGPKRFGRIFPDLPPFRPADDGLTALGLAMQEAAPGANSNIPAGFTYFGQFVDHDLTRDPSVGFPVINDPDQLEDARTPAFDLDSVYGMGPELQPELYDPHFPAKRARFMIGAAGAANDASGNPIPAGLPNDLPRGSDRTAFIGDSRNDENLVIAQTHIAFLKFHNKVIATLPDDDDAFEQARRLVERHYHAILLDDFLARILDQDVLADVRKRGPRFLQFRAHRAFMPIEFSAAAYRLGHSMVRDRYNYNRVFHLDQSGHFPRITDATLGLLFRFTGAGGLSANPANPNPVLPGNWVIDWRLWHEVEDPAHRSPHFNVTQAIDARVTAPLFNLPKPGVVADDPVQLAVRNLLRGSRLGLPRGQDVAEAMGVTPLTPDEVAGGTGGDVLRQFGFDKETPLWFYILREAELAGGDHLGQVGSRIVAETFVALLGADDDSIVHQDGFRPALPSRDPDKFTFADLLLFVNDINPIGPDPDGF